MDKRKLQFWIGAVFAIGLIALMQYWLAPRRPFSLDSQEKSVFFVFSSNDRGPGTFREAIFGADTTKQRAEIVLRVDHIDLDSPLPPLVNPHGIVVDTALPVVKIDARSINQSPVLEIDAPDSAIAGLEISNAAAEGILIKSNGLRVSNSSFRDCKEGIHATAEVSTLIVERTGFTNAHIGIWLATPTAGIRIENNHFLNSQDAAIWAVNSRQSPNLDFGPALIENNHFESDRLSLVLANFPAVVEGNEFVKDRETSVTLIGGNPVIRRNRIRNGAGIGISADNTQDAVIQSNEIDHNRSLGVLVRSSSNALVDNNRVYSNGYGIALVLGPQLAPNTASRNTVLSQRYDGITVIGESPLVRSNTSRNNGSGLKILDVVGLLTGRVVAEPFLDNNVLAQNVANESRGEYRAEKQQ